MKRLGSAHHNCVDMVVIEKVSELKLYFNYQTVFFSRPLKDFVFLGILPVLPPLGLMTDIPNVFL